METDQDANSIGLLVHDNRRMREAGCKLAEAALHVIREYDGVHRLSLAVADWSLVIANEGGRPHQNVPNFNATGGE